MCSEVRNPQAQHQPSVLAANTAYNMQPMAAAAQALGQGIMAGNAANMASISYDANVRYLVDAAMQSIRNTGGDQRARLLARIETNARLLAISIQEYEDFMQSDEALSHQDAQAAAAAAAAGGGGGSSAGDESMTDQGQ